ncbi:FGGY family carbohydrate kinase [Micromonosporaceae bacterium Da 78-11]
MSDLAAAVDVGTSGVKALVVDQDGRILGRGSAGFATERPGPGRVEQAPADWWAAAVLALGACGPALSRVRVLAVTGQMQDLICVDEAGARRPAILYSDSRAGAEHDELSAELGVEWARRIDNEPDATSLPGKLATWPATSRRPWPPPPRCFSGRAVTWPGGRPAWPPAT